MVLSEQYPKQVAFRGSPKAIIGAECIASVSLAGHPGVSDFALDSRLSHGLLESNNTGRSTTEIVKRGETQALIADDARFAAAPAVTWTATQQHCHHTVCGSQSHGCISGYQDSGEG